MEPETDEIARAIDKAVGRAGGAVTALPDRCFCAAPLRVENGLVLCDHGHSTPWLPRCRRNWFRSAGEMLEFFECVHGLPFEGLLIRW